MEQREHSTQRESRKQTGLLKQWKISKQARVWSTVMAALLTSGCGENVLVFQPAGPVARTEMRLIILSVALTAIVVIPVIALLWHIVSRYRDTPGNTAPYRPEWSESRALEITWWGIPIVIIGVLGAFTIRDTFALTRPPVTSAPPLTVEVTSLQWKWLFTYPEQNIATVNYCMIPTNRPIQFVLTANAPMNSFWVPQLGGQEYTMPGMAMRLWLQADKPGDYFGTGTNFSGKGHAHMKFDVIATSNGGFANWVQKVKRTAPVLTTNGYNNLVSPGLASQMSFSSYPSGIFRNTVMQDGGMYMKHEMTNRDEK